MIRVAAVVALSALALAPAASASWHTATFTATWPGAGHAITYPVDLPRGTTTVHVSVDGRALSSGYWISLTCAASAARSSEAVFTALYTSTGTVVSVSLHQGVLASACLSGYAAGAASTVVVTYRR